MQATLLCNVSSLHMAGLLVVPHATADVCMSCMPKSWLQLLQRQQRPVLTQGRRWALWRRIPRRSRPSSTQWPRAAEASGPPCQQQPRLRPPLLLQQSSARRLVCSPGLCVQPHRHATGIKRVQRPLAMEWRRRHAEACRPCLLRITSCSSPPAYLAGVLMCHPALCWRSQTC